NPLIIVEVLSPSTERFDRGAKFQHYQTVASLQEYVLVAQDQMRVEHYTRQAPDLWTLRPIFGENGVLQLTAVDVKITLADLYSKVHFEEAEQPDAE
ncbi:MAG: Uma2 family endonuclease, partial [Phototrophicaceae bacterium]